MLLLASAWARADTFTVYATDLPPLAAPVGGSSPQGLYVELLRLVERDTGHRFIWSFQPWARAQLSTQADPRGLIVNLTRNEEREPRYRWIAPIGWGQYAVYVLRDHPATRARDLGMQSIGYLNGADAATILGEEGLPNAEPASSGVANARKLRAGRISGWAVNIWTGASIYEEAGLDPRELRALPFGKPWIQWLAGAPQFPEIAAQDIAGALKKLKDDGSIKALEVRFAPAAAGAAVTGRTGER